MTTRATIPRPLPAHHPGHDGHHTCTACPVCGLEDCVVLQELGMACDTAQAASEAAGGDAVAAGPPARERRAAAGRL
jgi:hypothetical protein